MAMLAEKKIRQKFCLNPRGKQWSDDQSKFGQRLLEKMGWSSGQGLGVNKQGPTDIVKVKMKADNKGLGFKENEAKWVEKAYEYNELLSQLASIEENEKDQAEARSSLENRSKNSKSRVHYHKFIKGKDISRYSEKDLASIIGTDFAQSNREGAINADYKTNQINKGSSTEYFDSKKSAKHSQFSESNTNEDKIHKEEQIYSFDKKHKKSKKLKDDDTQHHVEPNNEIKEFPQKSKKHKHYSAEQFANHQIHAKKSKKKKNLENRIEINTTEHKNQCEEVNNSFDSFMESKEIYKANKQVQKIKNESPINPKVDNCENPYENHKKENTICDKANKQKIPLNNGVNKIISSELNENKSDPETIENENKVADEDESNCYESNVNNNKNAERKKKVKGLKSEVPIAQEEEYIEHCREKHEDSVTCKMSKKKKERLKNNHALNADFIDKDIAKEENVISRNNKKINKQNMEDIDDAQNQNIVENDIDDAQNLDIVENENDKKKKSKKRKIENENETIYSQNYAIKRKKDKKEHFECLINDELNGTVDSELTTEHPEEEQLPKYSKKRNKSNNEIELNLEESADMEVPKEKSKKKKNQLPKEEILGNSKQTKFDSEITSFNNNEDSTSKPSSECLTVFGRKTRLKKFNTTQNPAKHTKFDTEEFMAFDENKNMSSTNQSSIYEDNRNSKNSLYERIYVEPSNEDANISMNVANYEYRLLTSKLKQLNIPAGVVKIVITNNLSLPKKLQKKLKLLYKSKYYKSLLPADETDCIEASVKKFAAKLQPKIDVINELLKIEDKTVKLASEISEQTCDVVADSDSKNIDKKNLTPEKQETLKEVKKELKLLSKVGRDTINATSGTNEELPVKNKRKMDAHDLKQGGKNKNEEVASDRLCKEDMGTAPLDSLQTRIEEKLKVLAEQMKALTKGKTLLTGQGNTNERKSVSCVRGRGRWDKTEPQNHLDDRFQTPTRNGKETTDETCGRYGRGGGIRSSWGLGFGFGQGAERRQSRGRGVGRVQRGRISKNNFDAKQYADKCKFNNILPEITFKGVDLKVIAGYAANSSGQSGFASSSPKLSVDT